MALQPCTSQAVACRSHKIGSSNIDGRSLAPENCHTCNSERLAGSREQFRERAAFFHEEDLRYLRFLIPEGLRVLEIGCGTGAVLAGLKPSFGLGIDISPAMIEQAKRLHHDLHFKVGDVEDADFVASLPGPFDVILDCRYDRRA